MTLIHVQHCFFLVYFHANKIIPAIAVCSLAFSLQVLPARMHTFPNIMLTQFAKTRRITRHTEVVWKLRGYLELMKWIVFLVFALLGGVSGSSFKNTCDVLEVGGGK